MILNDNSTQQINTLVIQLQNRITNLTNELKSLNKEIDDLDSKISDLEKKDSSQANDTAAMNAKIKANTKAISGKADKGHTHTKSQITDFDHTHDDRYYTESEIDTKLSGKADKNHTHTKSEITDFPTSLPANGGKSAKSSFLDEYAARPTSGNIIPKDATEYGGMRKDVVTSSMTDSGYPGQDGHLLTMFWDNSGRHDSQFFVSNEKQPTTVKVRVKANETDYGPWTDIITSQNIGSQTVEKASTAGTADKAVEVVDYNDISKTVKIGYEGPGVTADKLLYLAGYTEYDGSSVKLKDVSKEELIKWLGIPRIKYADYQIPSQTFTQFQQVPIELSKFSSEVTPNNVLCFMVIHWLGVHLIASGDWANSTGLKCSLIALQAGTGYAKIRCVYMV